jgi:hypothetical protein
LGSGLGLLLGAALPLSDHLAVNNDLSCAAAPEDDEEGPDETRTVPLEPEELEPEATLSAPLKPETAEPVTTKASPLEPVPDTSLERILRVPDPVEMPTPVDTLMSPPWPEDEELEPAEISTLPPLLL